MCCNPCFLIVGCRTKPKKIDRPEGFPNPPAKVLCPRCGNIADSEYKRYKYRCHLCFIPCLPCGGSDPFLACTVCGHDLGVIGDYKCHSCEVTTTFECRNCPNCGASKNGGPPENGYRQLG